MGRRFLLLLSALLVAALGTTLVFLYVKGIERRAVKDQELVSVLFAKKPIAAGTTVDQATRAAALELREVTRSSSADGAISDLGELAGQSALAPIYPGEQILRQKFGTSGGTSELLIPEGLIAVSVELSDPARVAGFVTGGSEVAVFVTLDQPAPVTQVLLPRVKVLGVGSTTPVTRTSTDTTTGERNSEEIPKTILTLALDQTSAGKLIYATQGELYFALLSPSSKIAAGGPITSTNVLK